MVYLAELWLILESDLVERAPHKIFDEQFKHDWYILGTCLDALVYGTG